MRDKAEQVAQELQGTCNSLSTVLRNLFGADEAEKIESDKDFCFHLDNEVFLCDECGWWCELCESSIVDSTKCDECAPENDE